MTGATGFVGRTLCPLLRERGWGVRVAVREPSAVDALPKDVEPWVVGGIENPSSSLREALDGVDAVVHLAARVHMVRDRSKSSLSAYRIVNTEATERLARLAVAAGVKRFVFVSSVKVNGEMTRPGWSFAESDSAAPEDAYGVSKWLAEYMLERVAQESNLKVVVLRFPLVYGPWVSANFLTLLAVVARGVPLPLSLVNNARSMLYVGNAADAIVWSLDHYRGAFERYMVSDGEDVSTPQLLRMIAKALGRPCRLFPFPPRLLRWGAWGIGRPDLARRLLDSLAVDSCRIRRELAWSPPYSMERGLVLTAKWYAGRQASL